MIIQFVVLVELYEILQYPFLQPLKVCLNVSTTGESLFPDLCHCSISESVFCPITPS